LAMPCSLPTGNQMCVARIETADADEHFLITAF
jgi:hypothetical protein